MLEGLAAKELMVGCVTGAAAGAVVQPAAVPTTAIKDKAVSIRNHFREFTFTSIFYVFPLI